MEIIIYDHQIFAVNRNKAENFSDSLVYKVLHGTRRERFLKLQKLLSQTKYTTYDLA